MVKNQRADTDRDRRAKQQRHVKQEQPDHGGQETGCVTESDQQVIASLALIPHK